MSTIASRAKSPDHVRIMERFMDRAPQRPKTKIPRNFYIDETYFEPQKQAKPRILKMAELALFAWYYGALPTGFGEV